MNKKTKEIFNILPNEIQRFFLTLSLVLIINVVFFSTCNYFDCYSINFMNLFRTNLICNGCSSLSYHIMNYQMEIYLGIGVYFTTSLKKSVDKVIGKIV